MFESVLERNLPPRQIGRGAGLAIGVHAVVIAGALYFSARPAPVIDKELHVVKIFAQNSPIVQPGPANGGGGAPQDRPKAERRPPLRSTPVDIDKNRHRPGESPSGSAISNSSHLANDNSGAGADSPGTIGGKGEGSGTGIGGGTTIAIPFG